MAELFVDSSGRKPKCYWRDSSCRNGKWYYIKTGPEALFIVMFPIQLLIGFCFWAVWGATLSWVIPTTIIFMIIHCFLYPYSEVYTVLRKSKDIKDILAEGHPIYIAPSKGLSSICFIVPDKKYMFFKTLTYGDSRIDSNESGWYAYKGCEPAKITSKYFEEPIEDLKSKLNYRCDLGSIINLSDSRSSMKKVLHSMRDISYSIFGK